MRQLAKNKCGLYDVHGNAFEWVEDSYQKNYPSRPSVDPKVVSGSQHVARGGSWFNIERHVRSAVRISIPASYRNEGSGFRLLRVIE